MTNTKDLERLAEWLGWRKGKGYGWDASKGSVFVSVYYPDKIGHDYIMPVADFDPFTNPAHAALLEDKIREMGADAQESYVRHLDNITFDDYKEKDYETYLRSHKEQPHQTSEQGLF